MISPKNASIHLKLIKFKEAYVTDLLKFNVILLFKYFTIIPQLIEVIYNAFTI